MAGRRVGAVRWPHGDAGLLMIGFMLRALVGLAVVGVVGFDAGSVVLTGNKVTETAGLAAAEAARVYHARPDSKAAYAAAAAVAQAGGATLSLADFAVGRTGAVTLTVRATATTLVLRFVPGTDDLTHPSATAVRTAGSG